MNYADIAIHNTKFISLALMAFGDTPNRGAGSWKLEAGSWKREAGSGKREAGSGKREAGSGKREAGSGKREAKHSFTG